MKIILIAIAVAILIGVLYFLFIIWGLGAGFRNKFGPEFIPHGLGLRFNHKNYISNDNGKYVYVLRGSELRNVEQQIRDRIHERFKSTLKPDFEWVQKPDKFVFLQLTSKHGTSNILY